MNESINPLEAGLEEAVHQATTQATVNQIMDDVTKPLPSEIAAVVDSGIPQESAKLMIIADCNLIATMKGRLAQVALAATVAKIETKEESENASTTVILARKTKKQISERRLTLTRPLDDQKAALMAPFRELEDAFDLIDKTLSPKVVRYQDEVEARRIAAEREAQRQELAELKAKEAEQLEQADTAQSQLAKDDAVATRQQIEDLEAYDPAKDPAKVSTRTVVGSAHRRKDISVTVDDWGKVQKRWYKQQIDTMAVKAAFRKGERNFPGLDVKEISTLGTR